LPCGVQGDKPGADRGRGRGAGRRRPPRAAARLSRGGGGPRARTAAEEGEDKSGDNGEADRVAADQAGSLRTADDHSVNWHWSSAELASVRHVAVTRGVELLRTEPSPRLKQCPGDHCGWIFLDSTKQGNRRWCQMSECGQEAKSERRRQRRQAGAPAGS
jgi:predicted RNA-binding Zn ribbon-like protein